MDRQNLGLLIVLAIIVVAIVAVALAGRKHNGGTLIDTSACIGPGLSFANPADANGCLTKPWPAGYPNTCPTRPVLRGGKWYCDPQTSCPLGDWAPGTQESCTGPAFAGYVSNFPYEPNPLKIQVASPASKNYFMVLGDWGAVPSGQGTIPDIQKKVAGMMVDYYNKAKAAGRNLLFVATVGDNFYWTGLGRGSSSFQDVWQANYGPLTSVPWLVAAGNHDLGDSDDWAICPANAPNKTMVGGQAYGANMFNPDKGGYRPPGTEMYWMPDFNYWYIVPELDLIYIQILTLYDCPNHLGGNGPAGGAKNQIAHCGGGPQTCAQLNNIFQSGQAMVKYIAENTTFKNVVIGFHYYQDTDEVEQAFNQWDRHGPRNLRIASGHIHLNRCQKKDSAGECTHIVVGGGGGCCDAAAPHKPDKPGFFAMGFTDDPIPNMKGLCGFKSAYHPATPTDIAGYHPDYEGSPDCWYKADGAADAAADSYGSYEAYLRMDQ